MSGGGIVDWDKTSRSFIADLVRQCPTEYEREHHKLDIGIERDTALLARNQFTFYAEAYGVPETPELAARRKAQHLAWQREQRRPSVRLRRAWRFVKGRARDTWGVLLHGLPEQDF